MFSACGVSAAEINLVGSWLKSFDIQDLRSGVGSDFRSPVESDVNEKSIEISNATGLSWAIKVRRADTNMPAQVGVAVRRTTNGIGDGTIAGGESYLTISEQEQVLFSGSGDRVGVGLQLRLEGISIKEDPGLYSAMLIYRVD